MTRRPEALPDSEWQEDFTILDVNDAYKHKTRGRVLEFLTKDQQFRNVAILDIELRPSTVRNLKTLGIYYR